MRRLCTRLLLGAAVAGGLTLLWCQSSASGKPARPIALQDEERLPAPQSADRLMGTASCASASCHNANGPRGSPRSEYSTWAGFDKHARAFQVLYDDRSERIAHNLYGKGAHAHEKQLCLNCHSMKHGNLAGAGNRFSLADGVSCESCHGPAERWLTVHYQAGFKEKSDGDKASLGMFPTKNLVARAKVCADCHIGNLDKGMEVNHDLIAAGHPRLNFEYAGYLHMYSRHWLMADEKARHPDFNARVWAIGQVVSARAAVDQLHHRAVAADKAGAAGKPWPEFAEYDCFACHKDLKVDSPRQLAGYRGRLPGSLPYGTWYLPLTETYAKLTNFDLDKSGSSVEKLKKLMEKPGSPPGPVAAQASNLLGALDQWLIAIDGQGTMKAAKVRKLLGDLSADGQKHAKALDWDESAQYYLALAALNQGLGDLDPNHSAKPIKKDLRALGERLKKAFPPGFDSPRLFDPLREPTLDSQFQAIHDRVGK